MTGQGEARTKAASEKLKRDMAHTIASFSTLDFSHKDESSLYAFDGDAKDAPILSDAGASAPFVIEMGTRNRKQIVDLDAEKKAAAARPPAKSTAKGAVKVGGCASATASRSARLTTARPTALLCPPQVPVLLDFQFVDRKRVEELVAAENEALGRKRDLANAVRVRRGFTGHAHLRASLSASFPPSPAGRQDARGSRPQDERPQPSAAAPGGGGSSCRGGGGAGSSVRGRRRQRCSSSGERRPPSRARRGGCAGAG